MKEKHTDTVITKLTSSRQLLHIIFFCSIFLVCSNVSFVNAAVVPHSGAISADTTWSAADVHLVTSSVTVDTGVTLTIEPGTIVKFNSNQELHINGALWAEGNASEQIVFTSYRDDSTGSDDNGDGLSSGQSGDWAGLKFGDSTNETYTCVEYVKVQYAGGSNHHAVYIYNADITIFSSSITNSASSGIYVYGGSPVLDSNTITGNSGHGLYLEHSYAGSPTIQNNTISNNIQCGIWNGNTLLPTIADNAITDNGDWGIYFYNGILPPVPTGNTITGNKRSMRIPVSAMPNTTDGNILAPNDINGVWLIGNDRHSDLQLERLYTGTDHELSTYGFEGYVNLRGNAKLTVDPGVIVKMYSGARLDVYDGALSAIGTADDPVVFTSYRDDSWGGDFNADGNSTVPINGDWSRIYISNQAIDAECAIDHAVIRYGGSSTANLYIYDTDMTVSNSVIANAQMHGLHSYYSNLTLANNEVFGNWNDGMNFYGSGHTESISGGRIFANFGDGIEITNNVGVTISGVEIFGNLDGGLRENSSSTITATGNWWGATDGAGGDAGGSGDELYGDADVSSPLTDGSEFSYFNAGTSSGEGTIASPTVSQGIVSTEWGGILYDLDRVILDYPTVASSSRYELFINYTNQDNTTGIGGNYQRLEDGNGGLIHSSLQPPTTSTVQYQYLLADTSHSTDSLQLQFIRENGYRAAVSAVWLVERANTTDTTVPSSSIDFPLAGAELTGGLIEVTGTAADNSGGSGLLSVEVGVDDGSSISWRPVSQLMSDGHWLYRWTLPADGTYTLHSRALDRAGNREPVGTGVNVVSNQGSPAPATGLSVYDTPADSGGQITVNWQLSGDDGADVSGYEVERALSSIGPFAVVGSVADGIVDKKFVTRGRCYGRIIKNYSIKIVEYSTPFSTYNSLANCR